MTFRIHHTYSLFTAFFLCVAGFTVRVSAQAPLANFTATPLSGCAPLVVNFQDLSTNTPTSWSWDFGNSNTSTLQNPTVSFLNPGIYTVKLTATNGSGSNTLTRTAYITVYESPTANFSQDVTTGCFPLTVHFTDQSSPGTGNTNTIWDWDFGNGNISSQQNPVAVYTASGLFTVTLQVTNDKGCSKSISKTSLINVTPGVTASFNHSPPVSCTPPETITFTNTTTGTGIINWAWDFGDAGTSTLQNPLHTYTAAGSYTVQLVATSSGGCSDTARTTVPIIIGGTLTSFSFSSPVCINLPVSFTNTSTPAPVSSSWKFGDGGTSTQNSPTHTYSTAGVFPVKLINTYNGCVDSVTQNITVAPKPAADFKAPDTVMCQPPLTTHFQDLTPGAVAWEWDFGDGGTSTAQNPAHTYTSFGNYNVRLIVTSAAGCSDTITKNAYVRIRRAVMTIPNLPAAGCVPFTINPAPVINTYDPIASWDWDFGDGGTSTLPAPSHTYITQGTYNVRLIITTTAGCKDTLLINSAVRCGTHPTVDFSAAPLTQCATEDIQFTDLSFPADSWAWSFGDGGNSSLQNPFHSYFQPGPFTVILIAGNNGCRDTATKINYVNILPPVAQYSYNVNCSNRTQFQFNDNSIGPLTWKWDFGDGNTSTATNPLHNFPALGNYNVQLIVTNGGCADTIIHTIHALDINPDISATPTIGCKPTLVTFTPTNFNFSDVNGYIWTFGDGGQAPQNSPLTSHTYVNAGTYTVSLVTYDINGCYDTIVKPAYIRINGPTAGFTASNVSGCTGLITTFNDLSIPDGVNAITNWQFTFGDGNVQNFSAPPFTHTYATPGIFNVKLKVTDASGCSDSLTINNLVTVTDPVPLFASVDTITCPGSLVAFTNSSTGNGLTHLWDFGDGGTSVAIAPSHAYANTGNYTVKLRILDNAGCADSLIRNLYVHVDKPIAAFSANDSVSSCIPLQVLFTNNSTFYSSVFWDFGTGGTSTLTNPSHFFSAPGTYTVKLIITSPGGCKDSTTHSITVYNTSASAINYLPLSGCRPLNAAFNATSPGPATSYLWDFGDGTTQSTTSASTTHVYTTYGDYLPKMVITDPGGCLVPVTGIDTIHIKGATVNFGPDKLQFCDQGTVQFSDSTLSNDILSAWHWNFGDGGNAAVKNPSHTFSAPGIYNVSLDILTQSGCRDTVTKSALVKVVQRPLITIGGPSTMCMNETITHTGIFLQPDTSVVTWQWNFPNGNSAAVQNPPVQSYTTAGNVTVNAYATNSSGCKDTATKNITVYALPTATLPGLITIQNGFPVTIPATYSSNVISWVWNPATGLSCTDCPTPEANPKIRTRYQVVFTDVNGCRNAGFVEIMVICKNSNLFIPNTFSPNGDGSNDVFYPRGVGLDRVKVLRIFNRWGEVVFERKDFPVNDPTAGWNGTFKGKKPLADVYVYQAEVYCENGEIIILNGNISLIL